MPALFSPTLLIRDVSGVESEGSERPHFFQPKFARIENQAISILVPYSGLILSCIVCILVILRLYVFEGFLFPRLYGHLYRNFSDETKRTFMNHHIGGMIKIILLIAGAYPWTHVLFVGNEDFDTPMAHHSKVTMGDLLLVLTQLFASMYVFELLIRVKLSPIAMAHHIGAIVIAEVAVALSLEYKKQKDATIEYMLCLVWGAFDVLAEFWPNLAIILYRVKKDNHYLLSQVFFITAIITVLGTTAETVMIFVFLGSVWHRLSLDFKVATPILHVVFMAAQVHGSRILFSMYKRQKQALREQEKRKESGAGKNSDKETASEPTMAAPETC
ncbi:uncharacterized protein PV09_00145 [Verruconis gallopava]|uniref:TLC domain-containing protein n=1 Tax=Verruconis gallopava TaxID=253628 RepID=A0A0D2AR82_9PEZI|nr:uncharacterized protein PV09_00145 [Verruconis gallopava]KIW09218.1 hypothetical protein PV09_00145 [Verruconis gallopava]